MVQEAERQENAPITRRLQTAQGWLWLWFLIRGCGSDWQTEQARNVTESRARIVRAGS